MSILYKVSLIFMFTLFCSCSQSPSKKEINNVENSKATTMQAASTVLEAKSDSKVSGSIVVKQLEKSINLSGEISGLKPNSVHGFHIHEKSDCSAKDASSAGGHFNPQKSKHGKPGTKNHHAGDLGNIKANKMGIVKIDITTDSLKLYPLDNEYSIIGKSFIVHSNMDDFNSQPSGNAGKRIACGTINF